MKATMIILSATLAFCLTGTLKAQNLYVANYGNNTVGEYRLDGSTVNASLISGLSAPGAVAISGNDLFVALGNNTVGKYTTSGSTVNASLIAGFERAYWHRHFGPNAEPGTCTGRR